MKPSAISLIFIAFSALAQPEYYCDQGEKSFRAVDLETLLGPVRIALFDKYAPLTTENFTYYVNQGFYNNTLVHNIEPRFMLQAGLYGTDAKPKAPLTSPIKNESKNGILHKARRVAMWRGDSPDTATSRFFINLRSNPNLDIPNGYAVFGEVISGMDRIKRMQYQFSCHEIPTEDEECRPIVIYSAKLVNIPCDKAEATS
jgi:cyclophilin family peptidyl-prolyl cis-trans isomerase